MITPVYNRTSSNNRMTATDMNRICANVNEICGGSLKTNWTSSDIVDAETWYGICDRVSYLGRYTITHGTDYINVNNIERSLYDHYNETHHIGGSPRLTSLSISNGTLSPAFSPTRYSYNTQISAATSAITATTDYSAIAYILNGAMVDPSSVNWQYGSNTLRVTATLNGSTNTYTVNAYCLFRHASLTYLSLGGTVLTIADFMSYQTSSSSSSISKFANGSAVVYLNGTQVTGSTLYWRFGSNTLTIVVTASDTKTYTVAVDCTYQAKIPGLLAAINISDSMMAPAFTGGTQSYIVYPGASASTIEVIADEEIEFTIKLNNNTIDNGSEITWNQNGGDVIKVQTTADSEHSSVTYTVTSRASITITSLAPMHSGEIIAGEDLPGGEVE